MHVLRCRSASGPHEGRPCNLTSGADEAGSLKGSGILRRRGEEMGWVNEFGLFSRAVGEELAKG